MTQRMGLRLKLPLSLAATALFTTLVLTLVFAWQAWMNLQSDLNVYAEKLAFSLERGLTEALKNDDVWRAYALVRGARSSSDADHPLLLVIDNQGRIFVSNRPRQYPTGMMAADYLQASPLEATLKNASEAGFTALNNQLTDGRTFASPLLRDGYPIGHVLQLYPRGFSWPRFLDAAANLLLSIGVILAIILPAGWYWGQRIARPISTLANCMRRIEREPVDAIKCDIVYGEDELGLLARRFDQMLTSLQEKAELELQVIASERLAAVGRLSAEVAHEINNPLGGMLVAVDTLRMRSIEDKSVERTVALLERGLRQIQETVAALLVEVRAEEPQRLMPHDIEDTRTLVLARAKRKNARLDWSNAVITTLPLPSTKVRQIIINLLLNAFEAVPEGGTIACSVSATAEHLLIHTKNDGLPQGEDLTIIFEPYYSSRPSGTGLGLWICYEIVQQLGGSIRAGKDNDRTVFRVQIPLP